MASSSLCENSALATCTCSATWGTGFGLPLALTPLAVAAPTRRRHHAQRRASYSRLVTISSSTASHSGVTARDESSPRRPRFLSKCASSSGLRLAHARAVARRRLLRAVGFRPAAGVSASAASLQSNRSSSLVAAAVACSAAGALELPPHMRCYPGQPGMAMADSAAARSGARERRGPGNGQKCLHVFQYIMGFQIAWMTPEFEVSHLPGMAPWAASERSAAVRPRRPRPAR